MAKMKAKQRNKLPKKVFGIPAKRKFPLNDEAHVKAAVRLFGRASDADKPALARKILRRAKELGMDSSGWKKVHEWAKKSSTVKEYVVLSEFDHYFNEEEMLFPDEDITIRKATTDDLEFIVDMEMSTFSEKTKSLYPGIRKYCEHDAKKYLDNTEIIMDEDERIGIYIAYMDGDVWFISSITLLPEYQNKGIGSALIQHDIDNHDKIQLYVDIYNDKAKKLYERLGFRVTDNDDDHWIMELDKKNNVKLVDATKDDIDYIYECELQTTSDDEKKDSNIHEEVRKDAADSVGDTKIIMLNDKRVGIYQAYATNEFGLKEGAKDWWYIAEIYLSPDARGNGIGTSIIEEDISNHDKLLLNVLKENEKAIKLYKRLGFKIDKEFDNRYIMRLVKSTIQEYSDVVFETVNVGKMNPEQKARHDERQMHSTAIRNARKLGFAENEKQRIAIQRQFTEKTRRESDKRELEQQLIDTKENLSRIEGEIARLKTNPDNLDPATLKKKLDRRETSRRYTKSTVATLEKELKDYEHPEIFAAGTRIPGGGTTVDALGRAHDFAATVTDDPSAAVAVKSDPVIDDYYGDLRIPENVLRGKSGDFDTILNHEVGHIAQSSFGRRSPSYRSRPVEEYVLSCARAFIEKHRSMLNDHDADPNELHADYLSARKVGFNRVYKNILSIYSTFGLDENNSDVVSSKYRALFIQDMMWLHKGRPDRCSMKYPAWTPEVKKAFMEYFIDDTDECIQESFTDEKNVDLSVSFIKEVIKKIHEKTLKDKKPPTGNQNCQLCTWCLEAQCRGIDAVPRAVYSPRDKAFDIDAPSIVINPTRISVKDRNDVLSKVKEAGDNTRFYVHVNWKDSKGGHEFMLINIGSKVYLADAQQGEFIEFGSKENDYFDNTNYSNSYLVRLDDKELNKELLDEATDESRTLPWDEKKDIPYMKEHGMLSDDDEEHTKKTGLITEQYIEESYRDEHHNKLYFHISPESYLDGQVFKPRVPKYLDRYDPEDKNFENDTTPRVCFSPSIEGCLNGIMVNMPRVNVMPKTKFYVYIPEKPFHEYKHKTNKELIRDKDIFDASVTDEVWILEPVRMKLYGVIEIDSVYNVKRKQNVPTVSGKKSTRPYYKYKWHWLVKPKVLKKGSRFDYSVPRVIENLCMELPKFKYGLIRDGRLQSGNVSESDYNKYWVVHTPEEIDEAGGGNCYDMVEYEAGYLDSYGIECNKYYVALVQNKPKYRCDTHTFIVVKNDGKYIYIEQAFKRVVDEIGNSKEFDKLEDVFKYVIECMCEYANKSDWEYETIWDYTDIKFKKGTPMENFTNYITTNGDIVYEGKVNDKSDNKKKEE